ncbi:hypothetical protein GCM10010129_81750 [Streptomyces fumigatiscleroticus]|nr:hypothetical protein GCM10010129_81750 [Streptomyces fumigatiscleroticus]
MSTAEGDIAAAYGMQRVTAERGTAGGYENMITDIALDLTVWGGA